MKTSPLLSDGIKKEQAALLNRLLKLGGSITYLFIEDHEEDCANTVYEVIHIALIGPGVFRATVLNLAGDTNRYLLVGPWARLILTLESVDFSNLCPGMQVRFAPQTKKYVPAESSDGTVTATIRSLEPEDEKGPHYLVEWQTAEDQSAPALIGLDQILEIL